MIRKVQTDDIKSFVFTTNRGSYFLQKFLNEKMVQEIKVPKADVEFLKTCSDFEVSMYFISDLMEKRFKGEKVYDNSKN